MLPRLLNTLWMLRCLPDAHAFHRATADVARCQEALLREMLVRNRDTVFGREHGFDSIRTVAEYQRRIPLATYESFSIYVDQIERGASRVLTRDPVTILEPTSGTSSGRKLIPYTAGLQRQFQRAINPWISDLLARRPAVRAGRAYWSVSPALGPRELSECGLPIGFEDDTAYLGLAERLLVNKVLAVPPLVAKIPDMEDFRYTTLLHLLRARDLSLISVWSPSFLTRLLEPLEAWGDRLARDLEADSSIRDILRETSPLAEKIQRVWPKLALISCWTDAGAATCLPELRSLFPEVEIQPKGLIATEACVSFPLLDEPGAALALRSHFLEFIPHGSEVEPDGIRLAQELEIGRQYQVVVTTAGGLYRYQLFDIIEVVGFKASCPLVRFIGRANGTSDLVGEKLDEVHVRTVLERVFAECGVEVPFSLVVPVAAPTPHYRLYVQSQRELPLARLCELVQCGLEENPYYRHAIRMKQLAPLDFHSLVPAGPSGWEYVERAAVARGQKIGDAKPRMLDPWPGWEAIFGATPPRRRG